jgi:hypothetical protein
MIKRQPLELPPAGARAFVKDMKAFFAEENRYKQNRSRYGSFARSESTRDRGTRSCAQRRERNVSRDEADLSREIGHTLF